MDVMVEAQAMAGITCSPMPHLNRRFLVAVRTGRSVQRHGDLPL